MIPDHPTLRRIDVLRVLKDVIRAELKARSGVQFTDAQAAAWTESTRLGGPELEIDSLELVSIAGRVNELFHLHETGVETTLLSRPTLGDWANLVASSREVADQRFTLLTSGSSGVPKPCEHDAADLWTEVAVHAERFAAVRRIVTMVPANHLFGFLFGVMLPARLGIDAIDARAIPAAELARTLRPDDLLVAVPPQFAFLARTLSACPAREAVVSTGSVDAVTLEQLCRLGLARLTEIFGSTETGGIGQRESCTGPFELLPYWSPIEADPAALLRHSPGSDHPRRVALMDNLHFLGPRTFTLAGRVDHAVKIGGINVFPAWVQEVIGQHPRVAACRVRMMRPGEGERLKAFVVPDTELMREPDWEPRLRDDLETMCRERLTSFERPKAWSFGETLPVNPMGKPADW